MVLMPSSKEKVAARGLDSGLTLHTQENSVERDKHSSRCFGKDEVKTLVGNQFARPQKSDRSTVITETADHRRGRERKRLIHALAWDFRPTRSPRKMAHAKRAVVPRQPRPRCCHRARSKQPQLG